VERAGEVVRRHAVGHPFAVGERYAETLPQGRLVTEDEGESPVAWQGARLSRVIAELADSAMPAE